MSELQLQQIAPHTQERAYQLQRDYLRRNSYGLAVLCVGHVLLSVMYGDYPVAAYFGLFVVLCSLYGWLGSRVPHNLYVSLGELIFVVAISFGQLVLPLGEMSLVFLLPFGVTLMAFSQSLNRGIAVFALGVAGFFFFPVLGFESYAADLIPIELSFAYTLLFCTVVLLFQVSKARKRVQLSMNNLATFEEELNSRETMLKDYKSSLSGLKPELDERVKILKQTFKKEALLNMELQQERASQVELTKAIHRDLRDPLHRIITSNERLAECFETIPEAASVSSYLDFATDGAKRMATMLDDLLKYTESNSAQKVEFVDLNEILTSLRQDLSDLIERSNATVIFHNLPVIEGFHTQLYQLFQNLITNALKFSSPGVIPEVRIFPASLQDVPGRFLIRIKDNGIGIPKNQMKNIFGLFSRAHSKENYEGSGVGLALCRRIAVTHNAELTVESVEGVGTQFTFSLPLESISRNVVLEDEVVNYNA